MRNYATIGALLIAFSLAGCGGTVPLVNVGNTAVTGPAGVPASKELVRKAILRAGTQLGWQMSDETPNMLVATLQRRKHQAIVEIPYTATGYSVKYRSSINLDEKDGMIHKNYNSWIQNLTNAIKTQLALS